MVFRPKDAALRRGFEELLERLIAQEGQILLGWRDVPVDASGLGETVKPPEPAVRSIFVARGASTPDQVTFQRTLYVIRKLAATAVRADRPPGIADFTVQSIYARKTYSKGMLPAAQVRTQHLSPQ